MKSHKFKTCFLPLDLSFENSTKTGVLLNYNLILSFSLSDSPTYSLPLSLTHSHAHTHTFSLACTQLFFWSLFLKHTLLVHLFSCSLEYTLSFPFTRKQTHTLSFPLSLTHSPAFYSILPHFWPPNVLVHISMLTCSW